MLHCVKTLSPCKRFVVSLFVGIFAGTPIVDAAEPFTVSPLPYAENALEPVISSKTISYHYGKHHKGYAEKLNQLVKGTPYASQSLEQIIMNTAGKPEQQGVFNNAAQVWNHNFYWQSIRPASEKKIPDTLMAMIDSSFGSYDTFKKTFSEAATSQFGSGYAWLVKDGSKLKVINTGNAENPMTRGMVPLLTVDVWEHAYYLDYQNKRGEYVNILFDKMLNWDFAMKNLSSKASKQLK